MAAGALISVREYLSTTYRPDCDYVDGVVLERNLGERDHSSAQTALTVFLGARQQEWNIQVFVEQRVQVKPTRFRVPDICILAGDETPDQIFTSPPLICIEILSKDDRMSEMQERINDYLEFGVPYVWVIDPQRRKAFESTAAGMREVTEPRAATSPIVVPLEAILQ